MASEYRFLDEAKNVDVTFITDAGPSNKFFFVTEARNYDGQDIIQGIDIGIQEYNEGDFIELARQKSVALYRVDNRGEACLVIPGVAAGRFSTNSLLSFPIINRTFSTPFPIEFGFTFRKTAEDWAAIDDGGEILFQDQNEGDFLRISIGFGPDGPNTLEVKIGSSEFGYRFFDPLPESQCLEFRYFHRDFSTLSSPEAFINGERIYSDEPRDENVEDEFDLNVGDIDMNISFTGIMRDIKLVIGGETLIDVADPSSGINAGTGGNATPTNIESVNVII